MLDVERNQFLVRALYGLLMILPQSEAFLMLKQRLDCVPNYYSKVTDVERDVKSQLSSSSSPIDFKQLLAHFIQVQEKHRFFKRQNKRVR